MTKERLKDFGKTVLLMAVFLAISFLITLIQNGIPTCGLV
jgi:hypothetical protein